MQFMLAFSLFMIVIVFAVHHSNALATTTCTTSAQCGSNGNCSNSGICVCKTGSYVTISADQPCAYEKKKKLAAFLLSFFIGVFGADWFYLASGNAGYIVAGIFKLITIGGFGVWALVDWIRVLNNTFPDGQGVALEDWK